MDWNKKSISILIIAILALVGGIVTTVVLLKKSPSIPASWQVGSWVPNVADCKTCGECVQNRTVKCVQGDVAVGEDKCPGTKPVVTQTIKGEDCVYSWTEGGAWDDSACKEVDGKLKSCGTFYETKWGVHCQDQFGNVVSDDLCVGPKPDKKDCGLPVCTYSWKTDDWVKPVLPYVCGVSEISRDVFCISDQDGSIVADSHCTGVKPVSTRMYPMRGYPGDEVPRVCTEGWVVQSDWGPKDCKNSTPCGIGEQTRNVVCYSAGAVVNPLSPEGQKSCPQSTVPVSKQSCDTEISCDCCGSIKPVPPNFCSCDWDVSQPECPEFWKKTVNLDVQCKNQDKSKIVTESNCTKPKPADTYVCNPDSIDITQTFVIKLAQEYLDFGDPIGNTYVKIRFSDGPGFPVKLFFQPSNNTYVLYYNVGGNSMCLSRMPSYPGIMDLVWSILPVFDPNIGPTDPSCYWKLSRNGTNWNLSIPGDPMTTVRSSLTDGTLIVSSPFNARGALTTDFTFSAFNA